MSHKISLLFILWCTTLIAQAQHFGFLSWSTSEGLAQSQVRSIEQDHMGYLWIGTLGGVSRFDGQKFKNFSKQDGLLNNQVNFIVQKSNRDLVFGSIGGLTIYNGQKFQRAPFPQPFESVQVNHILEDEGRLLVGTEHGLLAYDQQVYSIVFDQWNQERLHIKRILKMGEGFLICAKSGVYLWENEDFRELISSKELGGSLMDAEFDQEGNLLLTSIGKGLMLVDEQSISERGKTPLILERSDNPLLGEGLNFTGVFVADDGAWIKSRDGLFHVNTNGLLEVYTDREGLATNDVRAVIQDREGNIWIGTNGAGIQKFTGRAFSTFTAEDGISGNIVMDVLKDPNNNTWFSTYDNGLSMKSAEGRWLNYWNDGRTGTLRNTRIWCSILREDASVYFGSSGGLFTEPDNPRYWTAAEGLPHNQVLSLEERDGKLYIGTARGLCFLDERQAIQVFEAIPEVKVRSIAFDEQGVLWTASNRGVYVWDGSALQHFGEEEGLPDNSVYCLALDENGRAWIGTESGLSIIENGSISVLQIPGGFGSNHINFIQFDEAQGVWLGTNNGLLFASNSEALLQGNEQWRSFGKHDGLSVLETNQNSAFLNEDELYFGTSEALVRLDLKALASERALSQPLVQISEVRVNLEDPDWKKYKKEIQSYGSWPEEVVFPHQDNHLSFYFDGLSLSDPDNITYQYRLLGLDEEWERSTEMDFVTYSNLDFEDYVFELKAIDRFGMSSEVKRFAFTILPPFWLSWWFIALEVIFVGGVAYLISASRRKSLLNKLEKEKFEYRSKMLALEQQTLNSSMNRHFIFNALNSIQYYINRQDRLSANRYLSSFAKLIRKNLDSSQNNLTTLQEEIERLELYLGLEKMRFKEKFDYEIDIDEELDPSVIMVPAMLLQPFLENSIWHGILPKEAPGSIVVDIRREDQRVALKISDNGIGIETSLKNKSEDQDHISKGMAITSGRIELIKKMTNKNVELIGPLELRDEAGAVKGTEVTIILPLDFEGV